MNKEKSIQKILAMKTIAVVGLSPKIGRPSNNVAKYLQSVGYKIVPVNPGHSEILGEKSYPTLRDIPFDVDVVDVKTMIVPGKPKRIIGTRKFTKTPKWKKAVYFKNSIIISAAFFPERNIPPNTGPIRGAPNTALAPIPEINNPG